MNKLFLIEYEFEDGTNYYNDSAIVVAESESKAKTKLKKAINSLDSETILVTIFSVNEFKRDIFTRCGYFEASQQRKVRV